MTKEFIGAGDRVVKLITTDVEFVTNGQGHTEMREVPDTVREWPAELVLLAMGFTGPEPDSIVSSRGLKLDERGNIQTDRNYRSNVPGIFAAGDANRGQSLIVWAISEGREVARCVDTYLMGTSMLPAKGGTGSSKNITQEHGGVYRFRFHRSGVSPAAGQRNGRVERKGNSKK